MSNRIMWISFSRLQLAIRHSLRSQLQLLQLVLIIIIIVTIFEASISQLYLSLLYTQTFA